MFIDDFRLRLLSPNFFGNGFVKILSKGSSYSLSLDSVRILVLLAS